MKTKQKDFYPFTMGSENPLRQEGYRFFQKEQNSSELNGLKNSTWTDFFTRLAMERFKEFNTYHFEEGWFFDKSFNFVKRVLGGPNSIPISYDSRFEGGWIIHNHPASTSFSSDDFRVAKTFGLKGMTVAQVTPIEGIRRIYTMTFPNGVPDLRVDFVSTHPYTSHYFWILQEGIEYSWQEW